MSWTQNVFSSRIREVGWDDTSNELLVTFKNGRTAAYSGPSEDKAQELANAPSVGRMFNAEIKHLPFRYV